MREVNPKVVVVQSVAAVRRSLGLAEAEALSAENDRIVEALTEEERSLTERRPRMTPEAFRAEAEAFDTKVQEIRRARDAKEVALQNARGTAREQFFEQTRGLIGGLMVERGGAVILDRRTVFLALSAIDITQDSITLIDATLMTDPGGATGDGDAIQPADDAFTQPPTEDDDAQGAAPDGAASVADPNPLDQ